MGTKKLLSFLLSIVMSISCVAFVSAEEKVNADGPVISSTRQLQESSTGMTYTIVYTMGDGGEGWDYEDESTSAAFTIRTLEETGITAKDGYTFSGWEYTPVTGEKKIYAAGDKVDLTELNVNIMNLAALWTAGTDETVKITYLPGEGAAGTGVVEDAASGAAFYLKGIDELGFSKEGSIFDKWKIDDSDDTLTDKAIFMAVKNTTFTATWKSGTAQVIIDYNYAGTEAEKTTYMLGETIDYDALVADLGDSLSRDGYTLIGFADDAMGTNLFLSSVDKHYTVTEDMTIYAVWAKNIDIEAVPEGNDAQKSTAQAVIDSMAAGNILDGSDAESKSLLVMVAENLANALKGITEEPVSMNIVLSKITSADDGKLQSITFDVTPVTESGKKIEKLNCWAGIIIPVPDELAEIAGYGKVNVNHGRDIYYAAIHGSEGKYYLHLSMDSFSPVTVSVPVEYDVTLKDGYGSGTKTVKLKSGDKMPGNPFKRSGYEFLGWLIPEESVNGTIDDDMNVIVTGEGFVMKALWISKSSSGGGGGGGNSSSRKPSITVSNKDGMNISSSKVVNYNSTSKSATIKAPAGYEIADVLLNGESLGAVAEVENLKSTDRLEVVLKAVEKAEEKKEEKKEEAADKTAEKTEGFKDISGHWAESFINKAVEKGLFSGTDSVSFSPDTNITRGMIAAVLYRMSGESYSGDINVFADVKPEDYYAEAVAWGLSNGIISGMGDGKFAPESEITREQLAVLIYKYAQYRGDTTAGADLSFADTADISDWARDAVAYCVSAGVISGRTDGSFNPRGKATRAEAASMLVRFIG